MDNIDQLLSAKLLQTLTSKNIVLVQHILFYNPSSYPSLRSAFSPEFPFFTLNKLLFWQGDKLWKKRGVHFNLPVLQFGFVLVFVVFWAYFGEHRFTSQYSEKNISFNLISFNSLIRLIPLKIRVWGLFGEFLLIQMPFFSITIQREKKTKKLT